MFDQPVEYKIKSSCKVILKYGLLNNLYYNPLQHIMRIESIDFWEKGNTNSHSGRDIVCKMTIILKILDKDIEVDKTKS